MIYAVSILAVVCALQLLASWRLVRSLGTIDRVDERLTQFGGALSLLADTTEAGFASVATEMGRTGDKASKAPKRTSTKQVVRAARRGKSVQQIAATQSVSEGEVRLRLHLAEQGAALAGAAKEASSGPLRA